MSLDYVSLESNVLCSHDMTMATFNISLFGGDALAHSSTSNTARHHRPRIQWSTALCLVLSLASSALATRTTIDELPEPTRAPDLAQALLLDTHIPVLDQGKWTMMEPAENELRRRATAGGSVTTTFEITISPSATATSTTSSSPLPSPFDGGISSNFTSTSCPTFFESMLADPELQACYPVSMMLQVRLHLLAQATAPSSSLLYADDLVRRAHNPSSRLRSRLLAYRQCSIMHARQTLLAAPTT